MPLFDQAAFCALSPVIGQSITRTLLAPAALQRRTSVATTTGLVVAA